MLLPIAHEERIKRLPWVTLGIIITNLFIFFLTLPQFFNDDRIIINAPVQFYKHLDIYGNYMYNQYPEFEAEYAVLGTKEEYFDNSPEAYMKLIEKLPQPDDEIGIGLLENVEEEYEKYRETKKKTFLYKVALVPSDPSIFTRISSMFIHGGPTGNPLATFIFGVLHIFFNMYFLWIVGFNMEDKYGRIIFPIFYLLAGFASDAMHAALATNLDQPVIGASGAVSGCMGAFAVRLAKTKVRFLVFLWIIFIPLAFKWALPAYFVFPFFFLWDLYQALHGGEGAVALWAHVGGFIFGAGFAGALMYFKIEEKYIEPMTLKNIDGEETIFPQGYQKAMEYIHNDKFEEAFPELDKAIRSHPNFIHSYQEGLDLAKKLNHHEKIWKYLRPYMQILSTNGDVPEALIQYNSIRQKYKDLMPPEVILFDSAKLYVKNGDYDGAVKNYSQIFQSTTDDAMKARVLIAAGDIYLTKLRNPRSAVNVFTRFLQTFPDHPHAELAREKLESAKKSVQEDPHS